MLHGGALRTQNSLFEFDCGKFHPSQPLERFSSKPPNHSLSSLQSPVSTAVDQSQQFGPCTPMATAAAVTYVFAARPIVAALIDSLESVFETAIGAQPQLSTE